MTLLTIVQDALNEIGDTEAPSSVVGNANQTAKQSLALANRALKEIARRTKWQPLSRTATITTVASQQEYSLPSDFRGIVNNTMWNTTQRREVCYVDAPNWAFLESFTTADTVSLFYRIFRDPSGNGQKVQLFPTPGAVETITYEYISDALTATSGGTLQGQEFLADTDTALLDEDLVTLGLKWRFLKSKGYPYAEEFADYERAIADVIMQTGSPTISLSNPNLNEERVLIVPDGNFAL